MAHQTSMNRAVGASDPARLRRPVSRGALPRAGITSGLWPSWPHSLQVSARLQFLLQLVFVIEFATAQKPPHAPNSNDNLYRRWSFSLLKRRERKFSVGRTPMKLFSLVLVVLLGGCVSHPIEMPAGHIVLAAGNSPGSWVPSEKDVVLFEADLAELFASPDGRFEAKPKAGLSQYFVRYYGEVREGASFIVAEGTHVSQMNFATFQQMNSQSGTVMLAPFGGGEQHFTALYDAATKRVTGVRFNAPL